MDSVRIFDTTLRDGEQSPGFSMNTAEKIRMARQLAKLGVDVIEAGFPLPSRREPAAPRPVPPEGRESPISAPGPAQKEHRSPAIQGLEPPPAPPRHIFLCSPHL